MCLVSLVACRASVTRLVLHSVCVMHDSIQELSVCRLSALLQSNNFVKNLYVFRTKTGDSLYTGVSFLRTVADIENA
jgi:hypothetical protein